MKVAVFAAIALGIVMILSALAVSGVGKTAAAEEAEITVSLEYKDGAYYADGTLIVNKTYGLSADFKADDVEARTALYKMFACAKEDGITLFSVSGYRSYARQKQLYESYVKLDGAAVADRYSARPGHSEHQTGLAFDVNAADRSFVGTKEAAWLAENCARFGFIIRYPEGKEDKTGFMFEPWHVRYVGAELAETLSSSGLCLEEYFGITSEYK